MIFCCAVGVGGWWWVSLAAATMVSCMYLAGVTTATMAGSTPDSSSSGTVANWWATSNRSQTSFVPARSRHWVRWLCVVSDEVWAAR